MDDGSNRGGDALPLDALERIEAACRLFEAAWKRAEEPSIERFLGETIGIERRALLRELILLDLDYRRRRGETPIAEDYRRRLAADGAEIAVVFALPEASSSATATTPPTDGEDEADPTLRIGTTIGSSRLLKFMGRGAAGDVYLAFDARASRGMAALKVIAPGGDPVEVLRRFEEDRSSLARVSHPSIARVLASGATEDGLPYFVSEHVPGEPITRFADHQLLSIRERLALFVQLCDAIEHAHDRGLIHGSLKPSNVLVVRGDGKPLPRVTDFGVARATRGVARRMAAGGQSRRHTGELECMSPEAATGEGDLDQQADVYSLGVIFYELLTGKLPFRRRDLRRSTYAEVLRIIQERQPPTPSARLSDSEGALGRAAHAREMRPEALLGELRLDLDGIAMKAIEKDPACRYEAVSVLRKDVERYLRDEPVSVAVPGLVYRLRKIARRLAGRWWRR